MDQWSKTTSHKKNGIRIHLQYGELRYYRGSRLVSKFVLRFLSVNFKDTFKTGESLFYHLLQARLLHRQQHQVDNETREREDRTESETSPVPVSTDVDDRTGATR